MFYLTHFYQTLFQAPLKSFLFIFLGCALVGGFAYQEALKRKMFNLEPTSGHYFYALISNKKNHHESARKLRRLPGVHRVLSLSTETIKKETQKALSKTYPELSWDNDSGWEKALNTLPYRGLKVIFSPSLQERSQKLVRDYLVKLVGKNAITLGAIKYNEDLLTKKKSAIRLLQEWGVLMGLIVMSLFWLVVGISFLPAVKQNSYLIENFQRRHRVALKTSLVGMASLFSLGLLFTLLLSLTGEQGSSAQALWTLIPFSLFTFLASRSYQWSS